MAEVLGVASGVLALATFAFQSSVKLCETVKSFQSHQQRIRDLVDELDALGGILHSLSERVNATSDTRFSALDIPLRRCGNACQDFEKELVKCSARSSGNRASFRDWAKLRYMGEDIDGFRRLLSGYKLTLCIALTDANLRTSTLNAENMENYNQLLNTARADLEDRLERIDEKLEDMLKQNMPDSGPEASEVTLVKEERLSTERCLQICSQLSEHITQAQLAARRSAQSSDSTSMDSESEKITDEGLQQCIDSLARTAQKLERHEKQLFDRLIEKSKTASTSTEDVADLERLREEWESTRQGMDVFLTARQHMKDNVTTIDNYATGDAIQFMVSTKEKTIHGNNRGLGWRTKQVGGHLSDDSLQQIVKMLGSTTIPAFVTDDSPSQTKSSSSPDTGGGSESVYKFQEQYGRGFKLAK